MPDLNPEFVKRRKIAAIACIAALIILAMHSRCSSSDSAARETSMTQKSASVVKTNTTKTKMSDSTATKPNPAPVTATPGSKAVERVLFLGMDRAEGALGRTDGIVIGAFDYKNRRVGVISVPRDLYVDIPGLEQGRINTVYRVGTRALGRAAGMALLKSVIRSNLGVPIDYTAEVDFGGFVSAVDELGGITVDVKCPIEDCFWLGAETCRPLSLAAGEQHLDGRTALLFARSRHGRTDLDRGRRQQAVLMGLKNRLARPSTLLHLPDLLDKLGRYVKTDMTLDAMLRMGSLLHAAGRENIHGLVMRAPIVAAAETKDKKSVLVLNRPAWNRALAGLYDAPPPGNRDPGRCPAPDVGLTWRERKRKAEEKRKAATLLASGN